MRKHQIYANISNYFYFDAQKKYVSGKGNRQKITFITLYNITYNIISV